VHFYITNAIFDVKDHQLSAGLVPQTSYPWTSLGGGRPAVERCVESKKFLKLNYAHKHVVYCWLSCL